MSVKYRWTVILLLFTITVINYIDRSSIAFAAHQIQNEFGLSSTKLGLIMGAFGMGYIISPLFGGISVDRFGSKSVLTITMIAWSLAIGWTGAATGFAMLYAARTVLGVAEGPSFPVTDRHHMAAARGKGDGFERRPCRRAGRAGHWFTPGIVVDRNTRLARYVLYIVRAWLHLAAVVAHSVFQLSF